MAYLDRNTILSHLNNPEHIKAMNQILDKVEISLKKGQILTSDFYDPYFINVASQILIGIADITYKAWGGYENAERKKLCFAPDYLEIVDESFELALLKFKGNFKFFSINHRHILGALLSTGIKRDKLGDIIVTDDYCQVICDKIISDYLVSNVGSIGPVTVDGSIHNIDDIFIPKVNLKEVNTTVNSMRLDAVVSAGFNVSRNKAAELVKKEYVKVNWQPINKVDYLIEDGDVVSLKGKGRLKIIEIGGKTRKGRTALKIGIFT